MVDDSRENPRPVDVFREIFAHQMTDVSKLSELCQNQFAVVFEVIVMLCISQGTQS